MTRRTVAVIATLSLAALVLSGCATSASKNTPSSSGRIPVVAAENEYGDVASQIGGSFVSVTSIESNPNTDPHSYEIAPSVARTIASAKLVIENGLGYDTFMGKIESASPAPSRKVIDVQTLLSLPDSTPNPHLWYSPTTMPKVARAIAADLSSLAPTHAAFFSQQAKRFTASLRPWLEAIANFRRRFGGVAMATTEPVADYLLQAGGVNNQTPWTLQDDIMNGVDPSPQSIAFQSQLLLAHKVKVFIYNEQVTDALTESFLQAAKTANVPVVGVYETMPTPGYHYQSWMMAEIGAIERAVALHRSTRSL